MKCRRCLSGEEATYRVYTDAMEMLVCAACADEARKMGMPSKFLTLKWRKNGAKLYDDCKERTASMSFSIVPMLVVSEAMPPAARQALRENRPQDAAEIIMREVGLSCIEAGHLLDISAC